MKQGRPPKEVKELTDKEIQIFEAIVSASKIIKQPVFTNDEKMLFVKTILPKLFTE